jgi:hypothetical protein
MSAKLRLAAIGIAAWFALPTTAAFGQTEFGALVILKLSDPGGVSEPWRVQRQSLRT